MNHSNDTGPVVADTEALTEQEQQEIDNEYETAMIEERGWYHDNLVRSDR